MHSRILADSKTRGSCTDHYVVTRVELRLVNKYYIMLISVDAMVGNIKFDFAYLKIKDTERLYYKFIEDSCEFRGHGDILIE